MAERDRLSRIKDLVQILYQCLMVGAAGIAIYLFGVEREGYPRAEVQHSVATRPLDERWTWLYATVTLRNAGKRLIELHDKEVVVRVQRVLPLSRVFREQLASGTSIVPPGDRRVPWKRIGSEYRLPINLRVEPGESDSIDYEFVIPCWIETARVYTHIPGRCRRIRVGTQQYCRHTQARDLSCVLGDCYLAR